jgi:penicillin-binding protein 1B
MIKGPSLYNPLRNPERSRERRNLVLDVMAAEGVISEEHAAVAGAMPLGLNRENHIQNSFPAYLELVRRQLRRDYRDEDLTTKGLKIFTSFDPLLQRLLERSTGTVMDRLDPDGGLQSAAVVTRFDSGEVVAMVGGRKARFAGFNRALDARRPAGSLLKPAIYLAALEDPERFNLATVISDTPLTVGGKYDEPWTPRNFDRQPHGDVLLYRALAHSYNLATARLGLALGIDTVAETLARLGVEEGVPRVPSLMLGAGEYSPMSMAAMYQSIAAGGFRTPLRSIRDVVDAQGESLKRYPLEYDSTVSPQAVRLLHFALQAVVREGTGKTVYNYLPQEFSVAGKTGTTNDGRDSWFAGFSGDLLAVTWIGRDDNSGTGLTGSTGALKLWSHFMANASHLPMSYNMPDGMTAKWVDVEQGFLTGANCPNSLMLPFIEGSEPRERGNCSGRRAGGGPRDWFERLFGGR